MKRKLLIQLIMNSLDCTEEEAENRYLEYEKESKVNNMSLAHVISMGLATAGYFIHEKAIKLIIGDSCVKGV